MEGTMAKHKKTFHKPEELEEALRKGE